MTTYNVTITREDNLWVAVVQDLPKGYSGAMDYDHFTELFDDVPGFIADLMRVDPDSVEVDYRFEVGGADLTRVMIEFRKRQADLERLQRDYEASRGSILRALDGAGVSQRAMADVVGLSHQRVHQLLREIPRAQHAPGNAERALDAARQEQDA